MASGVISRNFSIAGARGTLALPWHVAQVSLKVLEAPPCAGNCAKASRGPARKMQIRITARTAIFLAVIAPPFNSQTNLFVRFPEGVYSTESVSRSFSGVAPTHTQYRRNEICPKFM